MITDSNNRFYLRKEKFREELRNHIPEFQKSLSENLIDQTVSKYTMIVHSWIGYIFGYTDRTTFEEIPLSDFNSKFYNRERWNMLYDWWNKVEVKYKLYVFLDFLQEKGYKNDKLK